MKKYKYKGYEVLSDGTFISPFGNTLTWHDDKFIKINIDGKVKLRNGLNILYEVYNGVPVERTHIVAYKDAYNKDKTQENLILIPRTELKRPRKVVSDEVAKQIYDEYGLTKEECSKIKNGLQHPSISQRNLAKKYGVSINTIQRIVWGNYGNLKNMVAH